MQTKVLIVIFLVLALSSLATCVRLALVDETQQDAQAPAAAAS
jgi:hypothetical protein